MYFVPFFPLTTLTPALTSHSANVMGDTHTEAAGFDAFSTNMTKPGLDSCLIIILCISLHKK